MSGLLIGTITRIVDDGAYVELPQAAPGFEYGPAQYAPLDVPHVGDTVAVGFLNGDPDDVIVVARLAPPRGVVGEGTPGQSAYELAVELGFVGTEAEWIASLHGEDGEDGTDGEDGEDSVVPGTNGINGINGRNLLAFQANGTLTTKTYPTGTYAYRTASYRVRATCRDRGTGADLIVNVYVDGVAAYAGAARPTIAAGSGLGSDEASTLLALTAGQFITGIEVAQVGTGWTTLTVQIIEEP